MVLDELLFCQLLEALMDRGRELATHRQAEHILNGTVQLAGHAGSLVVHSLGYLV